MECEVVTAEGRVTWNGVLHLWKKMCLEPLGSFTIDIQWEYDNEWKVGYLNCKIPWQNYIHWRKKKHSIKQLLIERQLATNICQIIKNKNKN